MSKNKLSTYVTVHDDDSTAHTFGPGDKLPKWAREKITNPNVWAQPVDDSDADDPDEPEDLSGAGTPPPATPESSDQTPGASTTPPALVIPPKGGAGSDAESWRTYATEAATRAGLNIEIPADANRADIIEALSGAGIATE